MGKIKDFSGYLDKKFDRLTIVEVSGRDKHNHRLFKCKCDCGNIIFCTLQRLTTGNTKSCGCLRRETNYVHGGRETRLFHIYSGMRGRCLNPHRREYKDYGGRGIKICDEWTVGFLPFKIWALQNGYLDNLSIDRIDVNGNYEPSNCKWSTSKEQSSNKRNTTRITIHGEEKTLKEWMNISGLGDGCIRNRISEGWEESLWLVPSGSLRHGSKTRNVIWSKKKNA